MGDMGISVSDYYRMSLGQYKAACEGYKLRLNRQEDLIRRQAWITVCGYAPKNSLPTDYKAFWPLEIDNINKPRVVRKKGKRLTEREFREFLERMR